MMQPSCTNEAERTNYKFTVPAIKAITGFRMRVLFQPVHTPAIQQSSQKPYLSAKEAPWLKTMSLSGTAVTVQCVP
jgi:hypothetical protein